MNNRFESFTVLIAKINRNIRKIKNQEMANYNLKSPHISCLYYLYGNDSLTATDLCEKCEEDKATISRSLEYLEKNGYLLRDGQASKRYRSPLLLTEKGREVAQKITDKVNRVLEQVSVGMSDQERIEFYRCLAIVSESLDRIVDPADEKN